MPVGIFAAGLPAESEDTMKQFQKECWIRYEAGHYGYKNGVSVANVKRGTWKVFQHGKEIYTSDTLADCKLYVGRYC